jgi:DinB family protein
MRPTDQEYATFQSTYVTLVPEDDVLPVLREQAAVMRTLAARVPADKETHTYGPGKWTVRQVFGHVTDAERVFSYRALCFSRSDHTPLPAFDENSYVDHARFNDVPLADLVEEFVLLRSANVKMFESLRADQWTSSGVANKNSISVRALAYVMAGHVRHHVNILRDRYALPLER